MHDLATDSHLQPYSLGSRGVNGCCSRGKYSMPLVCPALREPSQKSKRFPPSHTREGFIPQSPIPSPIPPLTVSPIGLSAPKQVPLTPVHRGGLQQLPLQRRNLSHMGLVQPLSLRQCCPQAPDLCPEPCGLCLLVQQKALEVLMDPGPNIEIGGVW